MKMTISLLQSYDWYKICPTYLKAKALQQIKDMLNKVPFDNTATKRGNNYEDIINKALREGKEVPSELECLRNKRQQGWIKGYTIRGYTFKGKMDYDDDDEIWDLKTTGSFDVSSYYTKKQHHVYALSENKNKFTYKIAIFNKEDKTGLIPERIESIPIVIDMKKSELMIYDAVGSFENFLRSEALYDTYYDIFNGGNK